MGKIPGLFDDFEDFLSGFLAHLVRFPIKHIGDCGFGNSRQPGDFSNGYQLFSPFLNRFTKPIKLSIEKHHGGGKGG
jgi:hypothetical protein